MQQQYSARHGKRDDGLAALAGGLFVRHWRETLLLYPLLLLPAALAKFGLAAPGAAYAAENFLDFSFLYWIALSAANDFASAPVPARLRSFAAVVAACFVIWLPFEMALLLGMPNEISSAVPLFIGVALLVLLADLTFRYYFVFVPLVMGAAVLDALRIARTYNLQRRFLLLRVLFPPLVVMLFFAALVRLPDPDGRLAASEWTLLVVGKIFWVLCAFLSTAAGMRFLGDAEWRAFKLDPYRDARAETLAVRAPRWLTSLFSERQAFRLFIVCLVLQALNLVRIGQTPPSAAIAVKEIEIQGNSVRLSLSLSDERHLLRGFNPFFLRLAGADPHNVVAAGPAAVSLGGRRLTPYDNSLLGGMSSAELLIEFSTQRDAAGLKDLRDLYLWYLGNRLLLLDMSSAVLTPPAGPNNPSRLFSPASPQAAVLP